MASISWSSGNSGAWTVASNWSPAMVPGVGDDAFIGAFGSYVVTIPTETVNSITLNDPAATLSSGSSLTINDGLSIEAGTLDIATGAVEVLGAFTNAGTVVDTGSLALFGGYGVADIERIGGSGGSLALAGSLDNTGGILDGSGLSLIRILTLGTIHGGTITGIQQPIAATLDGVTWQGLLDAGNSQVSVLNSLDVTGASGSGPGTITMEGGALAFTGSPTLSNAIISGSGTFFVNDTLTLSTSLQINVANQGSLTFLPNNLPAGEVSNAGTINLIAQSIFPEDNGELANIEIPQFDNSGTLETSGSGGLNGDAVLFINAGTFTNDPGALLGAFSGRITIAGTTALTNNGTIAASAGSIDIGTLLQGAGQVDASNGARIEFAGAVASTQTINMLGTGTLTLDQPAIFFGTIESFAPGDTIALGVSATPISYSAGDLKLSVVGNQTLNLYIPGPFSLANFVAVAQAGTTTIHVNGSSAAAPILQGAGQTVTYVSLGTAAAVDPGLTISDTESATLLGATISISSGSFPGDGDLLSANTTGTAIIASFNGTTEVLTLSGKDTLADYLRVLHSVSFDSGVADPTKATSQPDRTVTWVINDGTATSAPVTSTVAIQPTARVLLWTGASDRNIANAANWNDTTSVLNPANLAPDAANSASFISGGGTIGGTGTVGSLVFGGGNNWLLGSGAVLNAASGIDDGGAVSLASGATILSQGELDTVSSASSGPASLTVSGSNSLWTSIGTLIVGEQAASGTLTIQNNGALTAGGIIVAQQGGSGAVTVTGASSLHVTSGAFVIGSGGLGSLLIAAGGQVTTSGGDASIASAGADGSSASVDGPGSSWQIAGALQIGNAAAGMLSVTAGGTVTAAALDAGVQNAGTQDGAGVVGVVGAGSEVMVTGNATIGDAATGAMSILNGATFAATGLTIGGATGNGVVTVSGAGSRLNLSGTLNVGTTLGVGELTIGPSATVVAATAVLHGQVVNEGGAARRDHDRRDVRRRACWLWRVRCRGWAHRQRRHHRCRWRDHRRQWHGHGERRVVGGQRLDAGSDRCGGQHAVGGVRNSERRAGGGGHRRVPGCRHAVHVGRRDSCRHVFDGDVQPDRFGGVGDGGWHDAGGGGLCERGTGDDGDGGRAGRSDCPMFRGWDADQHGTGGGAGRGAGGGGFGAGDWHGPLPPTPSRKGRGRIGGAADHLDWLPHGGLHEASAAMQGLAGAGQGRGVWAGAAMRRPLAVTGSRGVRRRCADTSEISDQRRDDCAGAGARGYVLPRRARAACRAAGRRSAGGVLPRHRRANELRKWRWTDHAVPRLFLACLGCRGVRAACRHRT